MDMRFGTWNVISLYKEGILMTVVKELSKYKLCSGGGQEVRLDKVVPKQQANIHFAMERGMSTMNVVQIFFTEEDHISS
jgi:hypothetical protein